MSQQLLFISPIVNAIVTGLFAIVVLRQYIQRRRLHQFYWSLALVMAFLATVAYIFMNLVGPTSEAGTFLFRTYYLFGATIMPAWLGLGCLALAGWKRLTQIIAVIVTVLSCLSIVFLFYAQIDLSKLAQIAGTPGVGILHPGPWLVMTIVLSTFGVVAVAGVALYSGWKLLQRQDSIADQNTKNILWANACIFVGAILDALAGSIARLFGVESTFWLVMALGWLILFIGVLLASRRSHSRDSVVQPQNMTAVVTPLQRSSEKVNPLRTRVQ